MSKTKDSLSDSIESYQSYHDISQKRYSKKYSRSRSPVQSYKQHEFHKRRSKLVSTNEELYETKLELLNEKKKLVNELKDVKRKIESLQTTLDEYKSNTIIFLPCSHSKTISIKNKQLLDSTFATAVERLTEEEMKNEILLRQLRSKIFYSIEAKYPEIFKCNYLEKYTNENCGHKSTAECHEIKKFTKQSQWPLCKYKISVNFDCGHSELFECYSKQIISCSRCSSGSISNS
jgi:hypothetical protein